MSNKFPNFWLTQTFVKTKLSDSLNESRILDHGEKEIAPNLGGKKTHTSQIEGAIGSWKPRAIYVSL